MTDTTLDIDSIIEEINERESRDAISRININIIRRKICMILCVIVCLVLAALIVLLLKTSIIN